MALVKINEGLKEEYSMNKTFSAEYDFSCVRQTARADRFARVLTCARAIACVKRKGLYMHMHNYIYGHGIISLSYIIITYRNII